MTPASAARVVVPAAGRYAASDAAASAAMVSASAASARGRSCARRLEHAVLTRDGDRFLECDDEPVEVGRVQLEGVFVRPLPARPARLCERDADTLLVRGLAGRAFQLDVHDQRARV